MARHAGEGEAQKIRQMLKLPEWQGASTKQLAIAAGVSWGFAFKIRNEVKRGHNGYYEDTRGRMQPSRHPGRYTRPFEGDKLQAKLMATIRKYLIAHVPPTERELTAVLRRVRDECLPLLEKEEE